MAKTHDRKTPGNSSTPKIFLSFLGCFGFSRKIPKKKSLSDRLTANPANRKGNRMFSMFAKKKDVKTVPFEAVVSGEGNSDTDFQAKVKRSSSAKSKADKGSASKLIVPETNQIPPSQIVTEASEQLIMSEQTGLELRPTQTAARKDILRDRKSLDRPNTSSADPYQLARSSFSRVIDRTESVLCQPNSPPMERPKSTRNVSNIKPSQSFPSLNPAHKNQSPDPITNLPVKLRKRDNNAKRYDPIIGMSIVMVTLLIMLLWGRLCAIMCTAIWLYLVPIFRSRVALDHANNDNRVIDKDVKSNGSDSYSKEYRKRSVVFEGFIERNRRRSVL